MVKKKRQIRTTVKPNKEGICKALALVSTNNFPRGHAGAIQLAKLCFKAVRGNEVIPLSNEQASKIIKQGFGST